MVQMMGFEPIRISSIDFESTVSADFTTSAFLYMAQREGFEPSLPRMTLTP